MEEGQREVEVRVRDTEPCGLTGRRDGQTLGFQKTLVRKDREG